MKKLLLGLLGGATLGLLFAPEKGSKLRKKLATSDDKVVDFGKELLIAGKDMSAEVKKFLETKEAKEFFEKGKSNISELLETGKDLSVKGKKELKSLLEKAKEEVEEGIQTGVKTVEGLKKKSFAKKEKKSDILEKAEGALEDIKNVFSGEKK